MSIIVPTPDDVLAVARHPHDLADGFRAMQNILGLSNAWLDQAGDFGEEAIGKYLGPSHAKQIGPWTFQMLCSLLAVEWRMHVDPERAKVMMQVWESRKPQYVQPLARPPSKAIIERATEHVMKASGAAGGRARAAKLTARQLTEIGLKGARARWGKRCKSTGRVTPSPRMKSKRSNLLSVSEL
jgi:hypothetical protein